MSITASNARRLLESLQQALNDQRDLEQCGASSRQPRDLTTHIDLWPTGRC